MVRELLSNIDLPIPILPPKHVAGCKFLEWIVALMDDYRDLRLIWTVLEAFIIVFVLILVLIMIYKIRQTGLLMKGHYEVLNNRIAKIAELHERADKLNGRKK